MPTAKPRFTITTSKLIFETIERLATLQGRSKSAVVNDLLESVHPPLMRTVALLEAASEAPAQVREGLRETFEAVELDMVKSTGANLAQLDFLTSKLTEQPAGNKGKGEGASARTTPPRSTSRSKKNPHIVIRGSGQNPKPRKSRKSKR